jgi:hypothetical protein
MITVPSCSCRIQEALAGGTLPEHYLDEDEAVAAFRERSRALSDIETANVLDTWCRPRYFAIHYRGRHIISL